MELTSSYIRVHQKPLADKYGWSNKCNDVKVFLDGKEIGTIQSVSLDRESIVKDKEYRSPIFSTRREYSGSYVDADFNTDNLRRLFEGIK